jgi:GTP-binding protein
MYVIDVAGVDGRDPVSDLESLLNEVGLYNASLLDRPSIILANKCDLLHDPKQLTDIVTRLRNMSGHRVLTSSALQHVGLDRVIRRLWNKIEKQIPVMIPYKTPTSNKTLLAADGGSVPIAAVSSSPQL